MKFVWIILLFQSVAFASCDIPSALQVIAPGAQWNLSGTDYSGLSWKDSIQTQPTLAQVNAAISQCQNNDTLLKSQIQNDIFNIQLSSNTIIQKLPALIDLLKQKGLLQ